MFGPKEEVFEVTIGFKSGRELVLRCTEFTVSRDGHEVKKLTYTIHKSCAFVQLLHTDVTQIETITTRPV